MEDEEEQLFDFTKKRRVRSAGGEDLYDDTKIKEPKKATDYGTVGKDVQQTISSGGSGTDVAATGMTSMGVATGQPWLVGGGLALAVLSDSKKKKTAYEQKVYEAKIAQKRGYVDSLFRMQQSMGNLRLG